MRATIILAAFVATWSATAVAQPIPADVIAADEVFSSPALSPDGSAIVAIRHSPSRDELLRIDWRGRQAQVLLSAHEAVEEHLDWVAWKSNRRIVAGVSATLHRSVAGETGSRLSRDQTFTFDVSRVVALDSDGGNRVVAFEGQQRRLASPLGSTALVDLLPAEPNSVLVSAYNDTGYALWRVDVTSGRAAIQQEGNWDTRRWYTDISGAPVMRAQRLDDNAGWRFQRRDQSSAWVTAFEWRSEDINLPEYQVFGAGPEPGALWMAARSDGRERAGLHMYNTATGELGPLVHEHPRADVRYINVAKGTNRVLAACANVERVECQYFEPAITRHLRAISQFFGDGAEIQLTDMSDDASVWLIFVEGPAVAPAYYIYDRASARVELLAATTRVPEAQLSPTETFSYTARDGADLWGYLTVPRGAPARGASLVVLPHGGPEHRDYFQYDPLVQFLASRGHLVLQPQFRGSAGFGRSFQEAGRRQWGQRMQDDVIDGLQALVQSGRVDPSRVCIVGASYGGYVALAGAAFEPDRFRCAVAIAGVSNLPQSLREERVDSGRRSAAYDYWRRSMGDPVADRAMLLAVSPSEHASNVRAPILLIHGVDDGVVPIAQSETMDRALRAAGRTVRFVRIQESGHNIGAWEREQRATLYQELDAFLQMHLN